MKAILLMNWWIGIQRINYWHKKTIISVIWSFSYIFTALWYIINIVDAAVDAHLYDFNVDDNLSLQLMVPANSCKYGFYACGSSITKCRHIAQTKTLNYENCTIWLWPNGKNLLSKIALLKRGHEISCIIDKAEDWKLKEKQLKSADIIVDFSLPEVVVDNIIEGFYSGNSYCNRNNRLG